MRNASGPTRYRVVVLTSFHGKQLNGITVYPKFISFAERCGLDYNYRRLAR